MLKAYILPKSHNTTNASRIYFGILCQWAFTPYHSEKCSVVGVVPMKGFKVLAMLKILTIRTDRE